MTLELFYPPYAFFFSHIVHIDATPPLPGSISIIGNNNNNNNNNNNGYVSQMSNFSSSSSTLGASWTGFRDDESGIAQYVVTVFRNQLLSPSAGEEEEEEEVYTEILSSGESSFSQSLFQFESGDSVFVRVTGINGAGGQTSANSSGVVIDLTPPEVTAVVDGDNPNSDLQYQSSNNSLTVSWAVSDRESGVVAILGAIYELREGQRTRIHPPQGSSHGDDGERIAVGLTSWIVSGLELNSGSRYIPVLTFENGAGTEVTFESNGVIVDPTPPTNLAVSVVTTSSNWTEVRWFASDPESGIRSFHVGVVNQNGTLVTPGYVMFDGTATTGGAVETPDLSPQGVYRVAFSVINHAGGVSEETLSEPFR